MAITSSTWDPLQYMKFSDERTRPASICSPGLPLETADAWLIWGAAPATFTVILKQRFPGADVLARRWRRRPCCIKPAPPHRIAVSSKAISPRGFPRRRRLIFSNAALHWVTKS